MILFLIVTFAIALAAPTQDLPPLHISQLPIKLNDKFTFKIINRVSSAHLDQNDNGTFFRGNFSTLYLKGAGVVHQYTATSFTFKYPRQHILTTQSQEGIELQIMYTLDPTPNITWKHKAIVMSVSFVTTEYVPSEGLIVSKSIPNNINNNSKIDFPNLLQLVSGLKAYLYKGIHSEYPEDKFVLWIVRTELLLMSKNQLKWLMELTGSNQQIRYGLVKRLSDLNQISEIQQERMEIKKNGQL